MSNVLQKKMAGRFIVLDGPDGCGKSTQSAMLAQYLQAAGVQTVSFRDPGTTAIGEKIREILLNPAHDQMDLRTEVLLYMAARAQLWTECIAPALQQGKCVILDRWLSSTCAYQGYAGGFGIDKVINLACCSLERLWPDMTLILDADLTTSTKRLKNIPDRMEQKGEDYHQKVRQGFLEFATINKHHIVVINALHPIEEVHTHIKDIINNADFRGTV